MRARDVMSIDVATVGESASLLDAVTLLINAGASVLPVVTPGGNLVGILSEHDVIQHILEGDGAFDLQTHLEAKGTLPEVYARRLATPATSVMTKAAITATEESPLKDIADLMVKHRIHTIPVVRAGAVVGLVNRVALVKALLSRPEAEAPSGSKVPPVIDDDQLRRDVVAAIRSLGLPVGGGFDVVARVGTIHLWGNAYDEEAHRSYCAAAAQVRGVTGVRSHMQTRTPRPAPGLRR